MLPVPVELVGESGGPGHVFHDASHCGQFCPRSGRRLVTCRRRRSRALQLLASLQSRRMRSARSCRCLGVTIAQRPPRRRAAPRAGYPVHASTGHGGGYQLGAGTALPPLLLDPTRRSRWRSACDWPPERQRRRGRGGALPPERARSGRCLRGCAPQVPPSTTETTARRRTWSRAARPLGALAQRCAMARACYASREHVRRRRRRPWPDRRAAVGSSPYQLVTTGRRWYRLAYDRVTVSRLAQPAAGPDDRGLRARHHLHLRAAPPDAADYVGRAISASPYRHVARVRYRASKEVLAQHFSPASVTISDDGPDACVVVTGADDPQRLALYLAMPGIDVRGARTCAGSRSRVGGWRWRGGWLRRVLRV